MHFSLYRTGWSWWIVGRMAFLANQLPPEYDDFQPRNYDPQYTMKISMEMSVPDRIVAADDENEDDALDSSELDNISQMEMPDRIIVLGSCLYTCACTIFVFLFIFAAIFLISMTSQHSVLISFNCSRISVLDFLLMIYTRRVESYFNTQMLSIHYQIQFENLLLLFVSFPSPFIRPSSKSKSELLSSSSLCLI